MRQLVAHLRQEEYAAIAHSPNKYWLHLAWLALESWPSTFVLLPESSAAKCSCWERCCCDAVGTRPLLGLLITK
jgi:hypothetical protein